MMYAQERGRTRMTTIQLDIKLRMHGNDRKQTRRINIKNKYKWQWKKINKNNVNNHNMATLEKVKARHDSQRII